jgi:protein ImuB
MKFHWAGRSYAIACTWGPERIETGWWRTASRDQENRKAFIRRDYYRVETTTGARFWIFRSLADRQWFLQGMFD